MTGDQQDMFRRLKGYLPPWFGDDTPVLDGVLSGLAYVWTTLYALLAYVTLQTRIKSATDEWLDYIANDFFGSALQRLSGQSDASFQARIIANLFRPRATRQGVDQVLYDLTGRHPLIIEPARLTDVEAYNHFYYGHAAYGSLNLPQQSFVSAYRPHVSGVANILGYNTAGWGYGVAAQDCYVDAKAVEAAVGDADIYAAVESVRPVGSTLWMNISN